MNINDDFISKENASQKFNATNSIDVGKRKPYTPIFDEYADLDNRKNQEIDLNEMNGTCKRGDITVGFPVSLKKPCYLEQSTEEQINKLISKTQNEDSISLLIYNELIKARNLSEAKSKSTAAIQPPPGYVQPIYNDDLKLNATIRALNVTLNDDQAIDIDEEQDEGQDEELEASLLYANFIENQKKQLINSASIVEKHVGSCYNLLEDYIIDKRESLYEEYKKLFYEEKCHCEASQNKYSMRDGKLSKPLQRKLLTLDQIMRAYQAPLVDWLIGFDVNSNDIRYILVKMYIEFYNISCHYDHIKDIYSMRDQQLSTQLRKKMKRLGLIMCNYSKEVDDNSKTDYQNIMEKFKNKNELFQLLILIWESVLYDAISLCDHYSDVSSTVATNSLEVLWNEMRNRSCQFLGPQVQDDVLKFVIRAFEQFPSLSRRSLVNYVVFMLNIPKVSKEDIDHVVQLLYRAGCFKVENRDKNDSLMELKREYTKYEELRRQHDTQIIKIAMKSGIIMTREKWSQTLYGDSEHKSEMQSIMSTLPNYDIYKLKKLIDNCKAKIKSNGLEDIWSFDEKDFEFIASINFEKKQPGTINSILDEEDNNDPLNDTLSENFDFTNDSDLMQRIQQKSETTQVHILWLILCECQKRTFKILEAHADFMNKIIANQNIIKATNSRQNGSQSSYKESNSMINSQQQPWSLNRPQNTRAPYRHPNPTSDYDKRDQKSLNNHGLKAMGTNSKPYRQQQLQLRNISDKIQSNGDSTGSSSSSFSRGRNTPDFGSRSSVGYQNRGSTINNSDNLTWRQTNDTETQNR